jgi:hypothetical protein
MVFDLVQKLMRFFKNFSWSLFLYNLKKIYEKEIKQINMKFIIKAITHGAMFKPKFYTLKKFEVNRYFKLSSD